MHGQGEGASVNLHVHGRSGWLSARKLFSPGGPHYRSSGDGEPELDRSLRKPESRLALLGTTGTG